MLKKTITYMNLDGERTSTDFWFNINATEAMRLDAGKKGGLQQWIERVVAMTETEEIMDAFEEIILLSFGVRKGEVFEKTEETRTWFRGHPAYNALILELITSEDAMVHFVQGIAPSKEELDALSAAAEKHAQPTIDGVQAAVNEKFSSMPPPPVAQNNPQTTELPGVPGVGTR